MEMQDSWQTCRGHGSPVPFLHTLPLRAQGALRAQDSRVEGYFFHLAITEL